MIQYFLVNKTTKIQIPYVHLSIEYFFISLKMKIKYLCHKLQFKIIFVYAFIRDQTHLKIVLVHHYTRINIFLITAIICINANVWTYLKTSSLLRYVYLNLITHIKKNLSVVRCYATINIFLMTTITRINATRGV